MNLRHLTMYRKTVDLGWLTATMCRCHCLNFGESALVEKHPSEVNLHAINPGLAGPVSSLTLRPWMAVLVIQTDMTGRHKSFPLVRLWNGTFQAPGQAGERQRGPPNLGWFIHTAQIDRGTGTRVLLRFLGKL